ncbi:LytTR family transcriptional regulator [Zhouia spongiae]|uniref:LytTR family transcriptional regulator n=1 Tax=Zhouia spongiae TaxID=2202721 RepID=A0ABY3YS82_9FLAO|nr:LytTR family DNA-binding domain-containing protein [Zhouia spongiae]UNZ00312.1 LytTR family transcriptional regulator [Zhouia spongiae]
MFRHYAVSMITRPYPYLFSLKRNLFVAIFIAALIYFMNWLAIDGDYVSNNFVYPKVEVCMLAGFTTFFSILFITELIPYLFFNPEIKERWTVGKEFLLIISLLLVIAVANNLMSFFISKNQNAFDMLRFLNVLLYVIILGIIPTILIVWLNYTVILKQNLKEVSLYNEQLRNKIELETSATGARVNIQTNNKTEVLELDIDAFLFAKADGNYVDIYTIAGDEVISRPYRLRLQKLEEALEAYPFIINTHRSYIVNLRSIYSTSGNARNYRISFKGIAEEVPVSRNKFKLFKEAFQAQKGDVSYACCEQM